MGYLFPRDGFFHVFFFFFFLVLGPVVEAELFRFRMELIISLICCFGFFFLLQDGLLVELDLDNECLIPLSIAERPRSTTVFLSVGDETIFFPAVATPVRKMGTSVRPRAARIPPKPLPCCMKGPLCMCE